MVLVTMQFARARGRLGAFGFSINDVAKCMASSPGILSEFYFFFSSPVVNSLFFAFFRDLSLSLPLFFYLSLSFSLCLLSICLLFHACICKTHNFCCCVGSLVLFFWSLAFALSQCVCVCACFSSTAVPACYV